MKNLYLKVLNYSDFKKIWLAQVFSQISLNIITFALILYIFEVTQKATSISLVMIATAIPVAIFGPISGVLADKIDYRKILLYTNAFRFVAALLLIATQSNVLGMLEIIFLISALSQIFTPAESSALPLIVPKNELISANSLIMTTTYATLLVGYSIAGPLLGWIGPTFLFLGCSVLFLLATLFTGLTSKFDNKKAIRITVENFAYGIGLAWQDIKDGFNYVKNTKNILKPMIRLTVGWIILGAFITLLPVYSQEVLKIDPKMVGPILIGPAGIGMLVSAAILSRKKSFKYLKVVNLGFVLVGISLLLFSLYSFYSEITIAKLFLFILIFVLGFGSSMIQIPAQTLLHLNSDEDKRGRVFGLSVMQLRLALSFPALIVGGVSDLTSPLITMFLVSVAVFLYSLTLFFED